MLSEAKHLASIGSRATSFTALRMTGVVSLFVMVAVLFGCDQSGDAPGPTTAPNPAPAPELPGPATAPTTAPTAAFMHINNRIVMFPAAKLKLTDDGSKVIALLYSDDPPEAIKDDYSGNSFYLQMSLSISDVKDLGSAAWVHRSRSQEREDSPYGIYLSGRKVQLQPYEVRATFSGGDPTSATVTIGGTFLMWNDADSTGLPQSVLVSGEIPARVDTQQDKHGS
jgi:hypothetical protein